MTNYIYDKPERGGCLSWWLGVSFVVSILALFVILGSSAQLTRHGFGYLIFFGVAAVGINLACLYGIYQWKRWGVYGFAAASILSLIVSLSGSTGTIRDLFTPLIQIGLLWFLVHDKWDYFK